MKACKTEQEYLDQIIEPVRRCCKRYGYLPSVLIAQSCLENGYGILSYADNPQLSVLVEKNNGVGIKRELLNRSWTDIGLSVWQGTYISKNTPEQYGNQIVTIRDDFRTYDCMERSFADYLCFMTWASNYGPGGTPKYGPDILSIKDPEQLIRSVSLRGYATGKTYPASVMRIVNKHNLTQYDVLTDVEPTQYYPGAEDSIFINPNPNFEPSHNTSLRTCGIDFLYIHYVGSDGDAKANIDYYNQRSTVDGSADFYVGFAGDMWQYNMDIEHRYCWAVGGGRQTNFGGAFYGIAKNANGISIEMCVRNSTTQRKGGSEWQANSRTWYFEPATVNATVRLAKYLMKKYNIPLDHVIRHYDVNGKLCPGVKGFNDASGDDSAWIAFKKSLSEASPVPQPTPQPTPSPEPSPTPSGVVYRVQTGAYQKKGNADNRAVYVRNKSGYDCFIERGADGMYRVFCGSYEVQANAEKRVAELKAKSISCFVLEVAKP